MMTLKWSESLALGMDAMDATHREFVDLLAQVVQAADAQLLPLWENLVEHTDVHFAQEDRWMRETGFSSTNCHTTQHQVVLQVMREGTKRGRAGQLAVVRQMADELGMWFPQHAQAMDAALALHLRSVGYDPASGRVALPEALPQKPIEGCHSEFCREDATEPHVHPGRSEAQPA